MINVLRFHMVAAAVMTAMSFTNAYGQPTAAQQSPATERYLDMTAGLTLADAIMGALEREPSLRATRAELEAARGMRRQAALRPNPSFMFERREEPGGTDNQTMLQASFPLDLFRRSTRIDVAERELEVADHAVAERVRILINDIKVRYGQAAAAARDVAVTDNIALSAHRDLDLLRRRVDEGASPPLDHNRLAVEVHRLDAARLQAVGRADAAMVELKRSLGLSPDATVKLKDSLEVLISKIPPSDEARDVRDRPDVRAVSAQVQLTSARLKQAEAEGRPDMSLFASYMRMDAGFPQRGFSAAGELQRVHGVFHYASGGAMVMVPLWNRNQGAIAAARADQTVAAARLESAELVARAEVAATSAQVVQRLQALGTMAEGIVLARQNFDVVRQTYELGRATLPEVLAEQRRYLEFENEYTTALRDTFEARAALEFARGEVK